LPIGEFSMVIWSAPKSTAKQSDKEASVAVRNDVIGNAMTANSRCRPRPPVLLRQDKDGIATLTLNRPERLNALSLELLRALLREFEAMAEDKSPRLVVLAANGEAFCAGHDLEEIRGTGNRRALKALFDECSKTMLAITRIPPPVIARVHGIATAAGCQIASVCKAPGVVNGANSCQICDGAKSTSGWTAIGDGDACDDGLGCSAGETCTSGKCAGKAKDCDDKDKCTTDACDAKTGACTHVKIAGCK